MLLLQQPDSLTILAGMYILYSVGQFCQLGIPMHADCGDLRYPGFFFARKQIDHAEFAHKTGLFGNKLFIYYIHLLVYRFLPNKPQAGPKLFFIFYNLLSATLLWATVNEYATANQALFSVFVYLLLSGYHRFYACFDSIEKYAFLPVLCLVYLVCTSAPHYQWWLGLAAPLLFFFFKPTYIFEWLAAAAFALYQDPAGILAIIGGVCSGLGLSIMLSYSRFGKNLWDLRGLIQPDSGLYVYWLRYRQLGKIFGTGRDDTNHRKRNSAASTSQQITKNIKIFFLPALPGFFLMTLCLVQFFSTQMSPEKFFFAAIFLAALTSLLLQFRFYPYQYLPLVPGAALTASHIQFDQGSGSFNLYLMLSAVVLLLAQKILFLCQKNEDKVQELFAGLPHYLNRCLVAPRLAKLLAAENNDWLLVWGDCSQLNIYAGLPSPTGNEGPTPWNWSLFNGKMEQGIANIKKLKPKFLVPTIDTINWDTFEKATGLRYSYFAGTTVGDETFNIFHLIDTLQADNFAYQPKDFFLPCKKISDGGRHIWNASNVFLNQLVKQEGSTTILGDPLIVWGAGGGGRHALDLFRAHGETVTAFVDSKAELAGATVDNIPVHTPDFLQKTNGNEWIVIASAYHREIECAVAQMNMSQPVKLLTLEAYKNIISPIRGYRMEDFIQKTKVIFEQIEGIKGARILHVGSGPFWGVDIALLLAGAASILSIDIIKAPTYPEITGAVFCYADFLEKLFTAPWFRTYCESVESSNWRSYFEWKNNAVSINSRFHAYHESSAEEIPAADETFDCIFTTSVLEHLEKPAKVAKELARILKKGGTTFHFIDLRNHGDFQKPYDHLYLSRKAWHHRQIRQDFIEGNQHRGIDFLDWFRQAGLEIITSRAVMEGSLVPYEPLDFSRVHPDFRDYELGELEALSYFIKARKRPAVETKATQT